MCPREGKNAHLTKIRHNAETANSSEAGLDRIAKGLFCKEQIDAYDLSNGKTYLPFLNTKFGKIHNLANFKAYAKDNEVFGFRFGAPAWATDDAAATAPVAPVVDQAMLEDSEEEEEDDEYEAMEGVETGGAGGDDGDDEWEDFVPYHKSSAAAPAGLDEEDDYMPL